MARNVKSLGSLILVVEFFGGAGSGDAGAQQEDSLRGWQKARQQVRTEVASIRPGLPVVPPAAVPSAPEGILGKTQGEVLWVDAPRGILVLRTRPQGIRADFKMDTLTLIAQGRFPLEVSDLKQGARVKVEYRTRSEGNIAQSIFIQ